MEKYQTKICQKCGKEFQVGRTASGRFSQKKYCSNCEVKTPEYLICKNPLCGKKFPAPVSKQGYRYKKDYCSSACADAVSCNRKGKKLICEKCGKEFDMPINVAGWRYYVKFCPDCQYKSVPERIQCAECGKWFDNPVQAASGRRQNKIKYCSEECRNKGQKKNLIKTLYKKYGENVNHVMQIPGSFDKFKTTMQERYGINYACQLPECIEANQNTISQINKSFAQILDSLCIVYTMEFNLHGMFYDFCLPKQNVLIEINPTYTHTVVGNHYNNFQYNDKYETYHLEKTNLALKNGYHCIHIWQWDNWDKIIQLVLNKEKLYARKLQLKEINKQQANAFLNKYHIQDKCNGNIVNLGLYFNSELVQVMTFGKPRYNKNYQYELLRLCSHANYMIVGGAERLFKYFITNYQPKSIISYCDISKFSGDVYNRLGFKLKEQTKPAKIWSKHETLNKEYITDNLLRQRGYDQLFNTNYGKGTNNEELMLENGWLPVYDCGQKVYIWEE